MHEANTPAISIRVRRLLNCSRESETRKTPVEGFRQATTRAAFGGAIHAYLYFIK
jgi:hypothetical protein